MQWSTRLGVMTLSMLILLSCGEEKDADVSDIPLEISVFRADSLMWETAKALNESPQADRSQIYQQFLAPEKAFFGELIGIQEIARIEQLSPAEADSLLEAELTSALSNPYMYKLLDTIRQAFPYSYPFADRISAPLKRLIQAFPDLELPPFYTHVSGFAPVYDIRQVDQTSPLPNAFSFGLHYFLGRDFGLYPPSIPAYITRQFDPEYLEVQMISDMADGLIAPLPNNKEPLFVDEVVKAGIKQYFLHEMLPYTPDSLMLHYTAEQMRWANVYEERIYKELMDKLFEGSFLLRRDFLEEKPFTSQLSAESAPRLGEFLGWRIVKAYMDRNDEVTLAQLCEMQDYEKIFRESKYRP